MKIKKVIFSLMLLCLLAVPGSAWELSFEGHSEDLDPDENINAGTSGYTIVTSGNNHMMSCAGSTSERNFYINEEFTDYFELHCKFSYPYGQSNPTHVVGITLYDAANNIVFNDVSMGSMASGSGTGGTFYNHVSFKENDAGTGIDCYIDGVLQDSTVYTIQDHAAITKIKVTYKTSYNSGGVGGTYYFDDFTNHPSLISCDSSASWTDSNQYFRVSRPTYVYATWTAKVVAPDGEIIQTTENAGAYNDYSISTALMNYSGTYDLLLYVNDNQYGNSYLYDTRTFTFTRPSTNNIICADSVGAGKSLKVTWQLNPYLSGNKIYCNLPGNQVLNYNVGSANGSTYFTIPVGTASGSGSVVLKNALGVTLAVKTFEVIGSGGSATILLDKTEYLNTDKVWITYQNLPDDSQIRLQGSYFGVVEFAESWDKVGSGTFSYQLNGTNLTYLEASVFNDAELLASDNAKVAYGSDYLVYGAVYDAFSLTPIEGVELDLQGITAITDESGRYQISTTPGTKTLTVTLSGYNSYSETISIYNVSTQKNIYLVAISDYGGAIYGECVDFGTGNPVGNAFIQISNGTSTFSALGREKTGTYVFEDLPEGSTWTLTASKTGYDNYQQQITVNGSTYKRISLISQDYGSNPGSSGGSGGSGSSGSSGTTTDRPGREAARESMDQFEALAPALIALVVIKVFRELMK